MSYKVLLGGKAERQFKRLDKGAQKKIKEVLKQLEQDPYERSLILSGELSYLRYIKLSHAGTQYRVVFKVEPQTKEVGIIFLGSRENFYRDLKRYLG